MQIKVLRETFSYQFEDLEIGAFFINKEVYDKDNTAFVYQKTDDDEFREVFGSVGTYKNHKQNEPDREVYNVEFGLVEVKIIN